MTKPHLPTGEIVVTREEPPDWRERKRPVTSRYAAAILENLGEWVRIRFASELAAKSAAKSAYQHLSRRRKDFSSNPQSSYYGLTLDLRRRGEYLWARARRR